MRRPVKGRETNVDKRDVYRATASVTGLCVALLLLAACGGSSSTTAVVAKKEWLAQADAICKAEAQRIKPVAAEVRALRARETSPLTLLDWIHLMRKYDANAHAEAKALASLSTPPGGEQAFRSFLAAMHAAVRHGHESLVELERGAYEKMGERGRENREEGSKAGAIARRLGLKDCTGET